MSDRRLVLPRSALADVSSEINTSLREINRRIRWSGAAIDAATLAPQQLSMGNSMSPVPVWSQIASITLDPGRWVVLGNTSIQNTGPAVTVANRISLGMRFVNPQQSADPLGPALSDTARLLDGWETSVGFLWAYHLGQETTIVLQQETEVRMQVFAATLGAQGNAAAARTRLTAAPG